MIVGADYATLPHFPQGAFAATIRSPKSWSSNGFPSPRSTRTSALQSNFRERRLTTKDLVKVRGGGGLPLVRLDPNVVKASFGAVTELLVCCGIGAVATRTGVLDRAVVGALSKLGRRHAKMTVECTLLTSRTPHNHLWAGRVQHPAALPARSQCGSHGLQPEPGKPANAVTQSALRRCRPTRPLTIQALLLASPPLLLQWSLLPLPLFAWAQIILCALLSRIVNL